MLFQIFNNSPQMVFIFYLLNANVFHKENFYTEYALVSNKKEFPLVWHTFLSFHNNHLDCCGNKKGPESKDSHIIIHDPFGFFICSLR